MFSKCGKDVITQKEFQTYCRNFTTVDTTKFPRSDEPSEDTDLQCLCFILNRNKNNKIYYNIEIELSCYSFTYNNKHYCECIMELKATTLFKIPELQVRQGLRE